jgi:hypothetical protein
MRVVALPKPWFRNRAGKGFHGSGYTFVTANKQTRQGGVLFAADRTPAD